MSCESYIKVQSICSFALANSVQPPNSVITHTHTHIYTAFICSFLDSFAIEIIAETQAKFHLLNTRSFLSIYDTYWFLCICKSLSLNSSLPFPGTLCVWILSLYLSCELVPLYLFFNFSYKGYQRLFSSSVWLISFSVWVFKVHPPSDQWHNFIISVALFHCWVLVHCLYVTHPL